jgi:hypothetical protein
MSFERFAQHEELLKAILRFGHKRQESLHDLVDIFTHVEQEVIVLESLRDMGLLPEDLSDVIEQVKALQIAKSSFHESGLGQIAFHLNLLKQPVRIT